MVEHGIVLHIAMFVDETGQVLAASSNVTNDYSFPVQKYPELWAKRKDTS